MGKCRNGIRVSVCWCWKIEWEVPSCTGMTPQCWVMLASLTLT